MPFLEKILTFLYIFYVFLQKFNATFDEVDQESLWQGSCLALTYATKKITITSDVNWNGEIYIIQFH
jgi:hypothetical protein